MDGVGVVLEFPTMNKQPDIVLASNSPRRKDLLRLTGLPFEIMIPDTDESLLPDETPRDYVRRLAAGKARTASIRAGVGQVIIAADTAVVDGETVLGKPADPSDAKRMLCQLRGRVHQVYTGIAVLRVYDGNILTDVCVTDVPMRTYSDDEIETYVQSGDPLDKAGAYGIQHAGFRPVVSMKGCYASVMGLPLCHVTRLLRGMDIAPSADMPSGCQSLLNYVCTVFAEILHGDSAVERN